MTLRTLALALVATTLLAGCAATTSERRPSRALSEERVALTEQLVGVNERRLTYVTKQFENGTVPRTEVSAAETELIDAKLRHVAARALLELYE